MSCRQNAKGTAVELGLSSLSGRHYSDLYKAIDAFILAEPVRWHLVALSFSAVTGNSIIASASNACWLLRFSASPICI